VSVVKVKKNDLFHFQLFDFTGHKAKIAITLSLLIHCVFFLSLKEYSQIKPNFNSNEISDINVSLKTINKPNKIDDNKSLDGENITKEKVTTVLNKDKELNQAAKNETHLSSDSLQNKNLINDQAKNPASINPISISHANIRAFTDSYVQSKSDTGSVSNKEFNDSFETKIKKKTQGSSIREYEDGSVDVVSSLFGRKVCYKFDATKHDSTHQYYKCPKEEIKLELNR